MNGQVSLFDYPQMGYVHVQKEYITQESVEGSMIAESFGIQGGYVNKIADILVPRDYSVAYITGESGSGKTTILNEIMRLQGYKTSELSEEKKHTPLFLMGGWNAKNRLYRTLQALDYQMRCYG